MSDDSNPYDMHNFEYQKREVERGKSMSKLVDCVDLCVFGCLKHLVKVFAVLSVASLFFIGIILSQEEAPPDKYEMKVARDMTAMEELLKTHPLLFGLQKKIEEDKKKVEGSIRNVSGSDNNIDEITQKNKYLDLYKS